MAMALPMFTITSLFLLCGLGAEGVITIVDRFTPSSGLIHPNFAADTIIAVVDCTSDDPTAAVTVAFSTTATSGSPVVNDIHEEEDNQMPGRFYIEATITGSGADVLSVMITCLENGANGQSITKSINIQATIQTPYFTMFQQEQSIQSTTAANTQLFQIEAMVRVYMVWLCTYTFHCKSIISVMCANVCMNAWLAIVLNVLPLYIDPC